MLDTVPCPKARQFFNESAELVIRLHRRWQDEQAYENIHDYEKPITPIANRLGVVIVRMHKRPFGCTFMSSGRTYRLTVAGDTVTYKRTE